MSQSFGTSSLAFGAVLLGRRRLEEFVLRHVLEVVGTRRSHISHDVVDHAVVGRRGLTCSTQVSLVKPVGMITY